MIERSPDANGLVGLSGSQEFPTAASGASLRYKLKDGLLSRPAAVGVIRDGLDEDLMGLHGHRTRLLAGSMVDVATVVVLASASWISVSGNFPWSSLSVDRTRTFSPAAECCCSSLPIVAVTYARLWILPDRPFAGLRRVAEG